MSRSKKKHGAVKWVVTALVIAAIAGGVVYAKTAGSSKIPDITCTSGKVMKQDLSQYITLSGTVSGKSSMTITGDPTLKVEKLNVRKGDAVKKGDVLCIFDSTSLQEEFDSLSDSNSRTQGAQNYTHGINQRNLENARRDKANALSKAQQDIDDAYNKRDQAYENYNNKVNQFNEINKNIDTVYAEMYETDNEEEFKAKEAQWEELKAQSALLNNELTAEHEMLSSYDDAITAAKRAYEDVEKSADNLIQNAQDTIDQEQYTNTDTATTDRLRKLSEQIEKCTVVAPMDGIISDLRITEGSTPTSADIMTISDASSLIVTGKVNENDVLNVKEDLPVDITANAIGEDTIEGKVTRVEKISSGAGVDTAGGYTVEISVNDPGKLLIGMSANAKIILDEVEDVVCVPYDSILTDDNDENYVWLATEDENGTYKVSKVLVKKGFEGDYYTEIASDRLHRGDIVLTGSYNISDGDTVELEQSEEE
ncbi:MAG: efflux RND transporter periplasmic adaptor subunit [Ruminococcus sp.]|nr:efflux RND transporter periplasmic adaptor subunit [Ruminococcus sp.]